MGAKRPEMNIIGIRIRFNGVIASWTCLADAERTIPNPADASAEKATLTRSSIGFAT